MVAFIPTMKTTSKQVTTETIRALTASRVEGDMPDEVLEVFRRENGKPFTKRILAKLPGGEAVWCIRQIATMTNLETKEYSRTAGHKGVSLLVAYEIKNVAIDAKMSCT